jgi:hypothetical protein
MKHSLLACVRGGRLALTLRREVPLRISVLISRQTRNIPLTVSAYNAPSHFSVAGCFHWPAGLQFQTCKDTSVLHHGCGNKGVSVSMPPLPMGEILACQRHCCNEQPLCRRKWKSPAQVVSCCRKDQRHYGSDE